MTTTTKLGLELLANAAANQTLANTTFALLNQLVQPAATDRLATPPGSPTDEALYIITATATGVWAGKENQLAYWLTSTGAWQYISPREGMLVHVNDENVYYKFDGTVWGVFLSGAADFLSNLLSSEVSVTGATTLTSGAFGRMHVCSGVSANYTVDLPAVSGNAGKFIGIRMAPGLTKLVTIDANGTELIDGQQTRVMWANEVAVLFCDGSAWTKVSGKSIPMVCEMYPTSSLSVAHATNTKVPLESVVRDNSGAIADPTTNKRMNIPRSGLWRTQGIDYYQPGTQVMLQSHCRIHVNGTLAPLGVNIQALDTPAADAYFNQHDVVLTLAAGDYVELYAYQTSTSSAARDLYVNSTAFSYLALVEQNSW